MTVTVEDDVNVAVIDFPALQANCSVVCVNAVVGFLGLSGKALSALFKKKIAMMTTTTAMSSAVIDVNLLSCLSFSGIAVCIGSIGIW